MPASGPGLLRFIVGRFFYTDPVNTAIAVMSLFAINAIGFTQSEARFVLIGLTVVAVIACFFWGIALRPHRSQAHADVRAGSLDGGPAADRPGGWTRSPFLVAGAILGSGLGGVAVTDRLLLLRLASPTRSARCSACTGWRASSAP